MKLRDVLDRPVKSKSDLEREFGEKRIRRALSQGERVEGEHTSHKRVARRIALAHLGERPDYYSRLRRVEEAESSVAERRLAYWQKKLSDLESKWKSVRVRPVVFPEYDKLHAEYTAKVKNWGARAR